MDWITKVINLFKIFGTNSKLNVNTRIRLLIKYKRKYIILLRN